MPPNSGIKPGPGETTHTAALVVTPPRQRAPASRAPTVRELLTRSWGSNAVQFGFTPSSESAPLCPNAVLEDAGELVILDSANQRIVVDAASHSPRSIQLGTTLADDLAVLPGGRLAVLSTRRGTVEVRTRMGAVESRLDLRSSGLVPSGDVTALLSTGAGLFAEVGHRTAVALDSSSIHPAGKRLRGRPTSDLGAAFHASLGDGNQVTVFSTPLRTRAPGFRSELAFDDRVIGVHGLESDGVLFYALVATARDSGPPDFEPVSSRSELVALEPNGRIRWRLDVPESENGPIPFHPLRAKPGGGVLLLVCQAEAAVVLAVTP